MSAGASTAANAGGQQFKCPNCNAEMAWDAEARALKCGYCRHTMAAPGQAAAPAAATAQAFGAPTAPVATPGPGPREISLRDGLSRAPRGLGTAVQTVQCKDCGATVNLGPNDRTAECTYCASKMVMPVQTDPNLITPESLIPFLVPKEKAGQSFKTWLAGLWFRPNNLRHMAQLEQIAGVYVPFWTFDCDVHSEWRAERGHYYYTTETETVTVNGRQETRQVRKQHTRWESAWGSRRDHYDDFLVCGSRGLPEKLADRFDTFNTAALTAYQPAYLAGWRAESYAIDLPAAWTRAKGKIESQQESRCAGDVGGDTHRSLQVSSDFSRETFKHVLLPVYVAAYRYENKPYRFLVNGQTGEVVGEAPLSFWKIAILVVFILAVIGAIVVLARNNSSDAPSPQQLQQQYPTYQQQPQYPAGYQPQTQQP